MSYNNHFLFFGKINTSDKCYNYLKRRFNYNNCDTGYGYDIAYFNKKIAALTRLINNYSWSKIILNPVKHYNLLQLYVYAFDWRNELVEMQAEDIEDRETYALDDDVFDANFRRCCNKYGIPVENY